LDAVRWLASLSLLATESRMVVEHRRDVRATIVRRVMRVAAFLGFERESQGWHATFLAVQ
jgi:hypothetical protein